MNLLHGRATGESTQARNERILRERAKALAAAPAPEIVGERVEFVRVRLGAEEYGFLASFVEEVLPLQTLTEMPCTPDYVRGVFVLRGEIVSVLDLKPLLGIGTGSSGGSHVVVLRSARMRFGVLVDAVCGVELTWKEQVQAKVGILSGIREEYLMGVTRNQIILLDLGRLLADRRLVVSETPAG
jgi:purine-binding chemotaxis protein CheW